MKIVLAVVLGLFVALVGLMVFKDDYINSLMETKYSTVK